MARLVFTQFSTRLFERGMTGPATALVLAVVLSVAFCALHANEDAVPDPVKIEIDLQLLLESQEVFDSTISDPLWTLTPAERASYIQIPILMRVEGEKPVQLSRQMLNLRGGRFVAFRIVGPNDANNGQARHRWGQNEDEQPDDPGLPAIASRLTSQVELHPDGSLHWRLNTRMQGGEIRDQQNLYAYKINPNLLKEKSPGRPPRTVRNNGEDGKAYAERRRVEQDAFRVKQDAYRELQRSVAELPQEFNVREYKQVWMVYEVPEDYDILDAQGLAEGPWKINIALIRFMSELRSSNTRMAQRLQGDTRSGVDRVAELGINLRKIIDDPHPYSPRLVAMALHQSPLLTGVNPGDPFYQLLAKMLDHKDAVTRNLTIESLASVVPPTPATLALLQQASRHMLPEQKLITLTSLLAAGKDKPEYQQQALAMANEQLLNLDGPDAWAVVRTLVDAIADLPADRVQTFADGLSFEKIPVSRLSGVIHAVIEDSWRSAVAAHWLDRLLRSSDVTVVKQTLQRLARAGLANDGSDLMGRQMAEQLKEMAGKGDLHQSVIRLEVPLLVDSPEHGLLKALQHSQPEVRQLAWQALPAFSLSARRVTELQQLAQQREEARLQAMESAAHRLQNDTTPTERIFNARPRSNYRPAGMSGQELQAVYGKITDLAVAQKPVPGEIAIFLANETYENAATSQLIRLVVNADQATGPLAVQAVLAINRDLVRELSDMDDAQRYRFAANLYQYTTGRTPLVIGLLVTGHNRNTQVINWFATEITQGSLPEASRWMEAFQGEQELLRLVAQATLKETVVGAAGALVASIGGDETLADQFAQKLISLPARDQPIIAEHWAEFRKGIFLEQMADYGGQYRFVIKMTGTPKMEQPSEPQPEQPGLLRELTPKKNIDPQPQVNNEPVVRTFNLGIAELRITQAGVSLAHPNISMGLSDQRIGLVINQPSDLKMFPTDEMAQVPLEALVTPIELVRDEDGRWRGQARLPDSRIIEIIMEPLKPADSTNAE